MNSRKTQGSTCDLIWICLELTSIDVPIDSIITMAFFGRPILAKQASILPIHSPLPMEEAPEQREWSLDGFTGTFLAVEWSAEKLDPRLFFKNRRSYRVRCSVKMVLEEPTAVHCLYSGVSSIHNAPWMERKLLISLVQRVPKLPWCC